MTTKHTPGPWMFDSDPVKGDPTGRIRYRVVATGKTISQTYYSSFEGGLTNAEADTRLMAAAPDLLAALKRLSSKANFDNYDHHEEGCGCCIHEALAAIAKATGAA